MPSGSHECDLFLGGIPNKTQLLEHGLDLLEHKNVGPPIGKLKHDFLHCKRRGFIALPTGQVGPVYYKGRRYKDNL